MKLELSANSVSVYRIVMIIPGRAGQAPVAPCVYRQFNGPDRRLMWPEDLGATATTKRVEMAVMARTVSSNSTSHPLIRF